MSMYDDEIKGFVNIINDIVDLKKRKAADYGNSWRLFGIVGIYYQIGNKFMRLWNLYTRGKEPSNESIRDTLKDMAVYCIMAMQLIDSGETAPLVEKVMYKDYKIKKEKNEKK